MLAPIGEGQKSLNDIWCRKPPPTPPQPYVGPPKKSPFVMRSGNFAVIALLVGTGGLCSPNYLYDRDVRGYKLFDFELTGSPRRRAARLEIRSPAGDLAHIKSVFEPSVTDLASLFDVSRQTIYNWQSGQHIAEDNEARLAGVARAADIFAQSGLANSQRVFRRRIADGMNFFALVKNGRDPEKLARTIVETVQREQRQRNELNRRLANRKRVPVDVSEIGAPHMEEDI